RIHQHDRLRGHQRRHIPDRVPDARHHDRRERPRDGRADARVAAADTEFAAPRAARRFLSRRGNGCGEMRAGHPGLHRAARRVMEKVRVSKLMSEQGLCSRREADSYIERGWVLVDGIPVTELGTRVYPNQRITLAGPAQTLQEASVTILLHKPVGYVSSQAEKNYRPAIVLVTAQSRFGGDRSPLRFSHAHLRGIAPAGRLDIDSTGLLVFTQDGRIAKRLIGGGSDVEKEYLVRVEGALSPDGLALLNDGLSLDGAALKRAEVGWQN